MIQIKKIATPLTIFSSVIVLFTGLWMFFASKGPVLEDIHSKIGLLFFVGVILHLIVHQKSLINWLTTKQAYIWLIVVLAPALVIALKSSNNSKDVPVGAIFHKLEEASINNLCQTFKTNCSIALTEMKAEGLNVESDGMSLKELAQKNQKSPRELMHFFIMRKD